MLFAMKQWENIERLGRALGVKPEALKKWRLRGSVPHRWRLPLLRRAAEENLTLDESAFSTPSNDTNSVEAA